MGLSKSRAIGWSVAAAVLAIVVVAHSIWLGALGRFLVRADQPAPADIAIVLAGDGYGHRIVKGAEMVRQGFVPKVLVSGPPGLYGHHECDLAIPFAVSKGYPESWFIGFPIEGQSTLEEAQEIVPELRRRHVRKFLVVTSDYHTRRAGGIYRSLAPECEIHVVAAPDEFFRADSWWRSRQGQKQFLFEYLKTVAGWLGI